MRRPRFTGGHANQPGLNPYGVILLEEMMARGMIIDVDHMSEKSTDAALGLPKSSSYPVICSHAWFRDLLFSGADRIRPAKIRQQYGTSDVHKVAHEAGKRGDQIERIGKLGGVVAPILNQGDIAGLKRALPELAGKIPQPSAGSSTSWAQAYLYAVAKMGGRGVAMGSDINGAAGLPGPALWHVRLLWRARRCIRSAQRRAEIDAADQRGGVSVQPLRDHRWYRFDTSGEGPMMRKSATSGRRSPNIETGFNPLTQTHPASDYPEPSLDAFLKACAVEPQPGVGR